MEKKFPFRDVTMGPRLMTDGPGGQQEMDNSNPCMHKKVR